MTILNVCSALKIRISICKKTYTYNKNEKATPAGNDMFKVNNRNTSTRCEICPKLTIKTFCECNENQGVRV